MCFGGGYWSPVLMAWLAEIGVLSMDARTSGGRKNPRLLFRAVARKVNSLKTPMCRLLTTLRPRPQVRRDYPLSLSISISGGKETYKDSLSNGERTGKSPALESGGPAVRIVVWRSVLSDGPGPSPLEGGAGEGESPVVPGPCRTTRRCLRVGLFGNAAPIGR